ncbi:hypothetical protein FGG08_005589 [Glutinoglossum americanum]|uniref:FAM192A/Fyv6 N-terminal domain-containing protein n=1 Tax=Glutinoglossum americanum TaxID=1670608 RepID=A0A9P8I2P8_9PEZI|nr:hypothetical protein FGG08_005589 [Glutinoglossum americanum]
MSSGFVSAGTIDPSSNQDPPESDAKSDEWARAQQEIEESRRRKEEAGRQEGGKSLFEVLEANKVRKQEAFEESIRLKNQFRSLDEDEVEFLDSVLESTRAREAALKKETTEQLDAFRKQQEEADKAAFREEDQTGKTAAGTGGGSGSPVGEEEQWALSGRKRKKGREKEVLKGVKLRRTSSTAEKLADGVVATTATSSKSPPSEALQSRGKVAPPSPVEVKLIPHKSAVSSTTKGNTTLNPTKLSAGTPPKQPSSGGLSSLVDYGSDDD